MQQVVPDLYYRIAGPADAPPLVMIHQSPGSSKQLSALMQALAGLGHRVVASDTTGNGDSDPLALAQPAIPDLAAHALAALDAMGLAGSTFTAATPAPRSPWKSPSPGRAGSGAW